MILVVSCGTGDEKMTQMTEVMLAQLSASLMETKHAWDGVFVAQGMTRPPMSRFTWYVERKNLGFAKGMNLSFQAGIVRHEDSPSHVLCINNDVEMPDRDWINKLLKHDDGEHVLVPTTNFTACKEQVATEPVDADPVDVPSTPAVAWMMPWAMVRQITDRLGPRMLFNETFGMAWGEDGYDSAIWQKTNPTPFRIVPRSWINHIGSVTSNKIPADERMRSYHASVKAIREDINPDA